MWIYFYIHTKLSQNKTLNSIIHTSNYEAQALIIGFENVDIRSGPKHMKFWKERSLFKIVWLNYWL